MNETPNSDLNETSIEQVLLEDCCSFEFFQAVALLQRVRADREAVGGFCNPQDEAVHFRAHNGLSFPASQIQEIDWPDDVPAKMTVNFMGLTGPSGVLPYCYTEHLMERLRAKDRTLPAFLDMFNHRMISFFYRAWEKYRFPATYARGDDTFTQHLLDFVGLGTPGLQDRLAVPDNALVNFAALFGSQVRSAAALEAILSNYFQVPVEVEQFAGEWYRLQPSAQCSMTDGFEDSEKLGEGVVVGNEIWDQNSRVRIKLGPLTLEQYLEFLPEGSAYEPLRSLVRFFSNDELDFEAQLILRRDEVPSCEIGVESEATPRLGWVSWMRLGQPGSDRADTILNL